MEPKYYIECFSKKVETEIEGFSYCAALEPIEVSEAVYEAFQDIKDEMLNLRQMLKIEKWYSSFMTVALGVFSLISALIYIFL
jgi:predicted RNA-binding protein with EMAP domain